MLLGIAAGNGIEYSRSDIELINKQLRAVVHKLMSNNDVTLLLAEYTKITAGSLVESPSRTGTFHSQMFTG